MERLKGARDARTHQMSAALVRHLYAFIREVEPTFSEREEGIDFLTRTGHFCDDKRQECVLLYDALGVSMLVDAINHRTAEASTKTTVLAPFFVQDAPEFDLGADISGGVPGEPLLVIGSLFGSDGQPLPGAIVDIWHSD
jgi:hydroxyquinol 1,2-dioxygenase